MQKVADKAGTEMENYTRVLYSMLFELSVLHIFGRQPPQLFLAVFHRHSAALAFFLQLAQNHVLQRLLHRRRLSGPQFSGSSSGFHIPC